MRSTMAAALVVIGLAAGCSSADKAESNKPTVPIAPLPSATTPTTPTTPGADKTPETALKYMQALSAQDPEERRTALELVEPGSPAEGYALFRIEAQEAARALGRADGQAVTLAAQPDGSIIQSRPDGAATVTFGGFKLSDAGKLSAISGNGQDLRSRLVKPSTQPVTAADSKLSLIAGLQSTDAAALLLVFRIDTGGKPVQVRVSASSYTDAEGRVHNADPQKSLFDTATISPGTTGRVVVALPGAAPGGRYSASVQTEGGQPETAELPALPY